MTFMIQKLLKKTIGFKFFTVIGVILLISTIFSGFLIARYQRVLLQQSLKEKGNGLISYVAKLSRDPLIMKDNTQLDSIVHEVNRDEDVLYAVIKDANGNILTSRFSSFNFQAPNIKSTISEMPPDSKLQDILAVINKAGGIIELSVPILAEFSSLTDKDSVGTATIGMSDQKIIQQVAKTIVYVLAVNFVTALLMGVALFFASRRIVVNPIVRLTAVSQRLAAGDLSQSIEVKTNDEIGQLGHTTNKMIADLKELIGRIRETASKTTSAAEKIVTGSRQVKQDALTTVQAAEGTFTSMEEMASSIKSVSENTESLSANVEQTSSSITEMMALVENAAANLAELTSSVTETSSTVEEMTVSIENVAKEAEDLSRVVYNAASSVEQMAKSVEQVDRHVQDAGALSQRSVEEAKVGGEALSRSFKAMKSISGTMSSIATLIQSLETSSREIGKILEVMEEIADQTNLLALNAAIQAAQAGDAGHGFAVVAREVRELADRSRTAAKEISLVISRIQDETKDAVKSTESGTQESTAAMEMADRAAEALNKIIEAIEKTNRIMSMIMSATTEQRAGSKEVLKYVNTMRISSDQVKRAMTEQATGGRQIRLAVENMNRIMQEASKGAKEQAVGSKQIIMAVENMNQMTRQVTIATAEQKQGGDLVVKSTENISHIAKENLKAAEQMAQSSEALVAEANSLLENVARFKL